MSHPAISDGRVAVISGAARGIGLAIARRLADHGMKLCLTDTDGTALDRAVQELRQGRPNLQVLGEVADVANFAAVSHLRDRVADAFGDVALLVNNAAITKGGGPWSDYENWQRLLAVNLWGVINAVQAFVPGMIERGRPAAIVNVGSKEGITTPPGNAAYSVSKAGVKVITEQLSHELRQLEGCPISAHLLIPGYTFTPMNFPDMTDAMPKPPAPWTADQVAEILLSGMDAGDFYIFCQDNEVTPELDRLRIQWSADDMILNRPALSRWHPNFRNAFEASVAASTFRRAEPEGQNDPE